MNFFKYIILYILISFCTNMHARDIYGYLSLGGNAAYRMKDSYITSKSVLTGCYDFKFGISYKKKYIAGVKFYNDRYIYQEDYVVLRHFVVYKKGVFIKAIQHFKNNFYVGGEYSFMSIDNNSGTSQTKLSIYSLCFGKLSINKTVGLEIKSDYLRFQKVNNFNFLISLLLNV